MPYIAAVAAEQLRQAPGQMYGADRTKFVVQADAGYHWNLPNHHRASLRVGMSDQLGLLSFVYDTAAALRSPAS